MQTNMFLLSHVGILQTTFRPDSVVRVLRCSSCYFFAKGSELLLSREKVILFTKKGTKSTVSAGGLTLINLLKGGRRKMFKSKATAQVDLASGHNLFSPFSSHFFGEKFLYVY